MQKSIAYITLVFAISASSSAIAQGRIYEIGVGGGLSMPVSPEGFREGSELLGFNAGGSVGFFVTPQVTFGGSVQYNRFGEDGGDDFLSITEVLGVAKYYFRSTDERSAKVYVLGGIGLGRLATPKITGPDGGGVETSTNQTMLVGGLGIKYGSSIGFFVEGCFSAIFTDAGSLTFIPVRVGIAF